MPPRRILTDDELAAFRADYSTVPHGVIAGRLGVHGRFVHKLGRRLGVAGTLRRWTPEEDDYLRSSWGQRSLGEAARHLGRRLSEASTRALKLGLRKKGQRWRKTLQRRDRNGYLVAYCDGTRSVPVHVDVMERHLGRRMRRGECVHHINGDKDDNRLGNLRLFGSAAEHRKAHMSVERLMPALLERGIISFDGDAGVYVLCETGE